MSDVYFDRYQRFMEALLPECMVQDYREQIEAGDVEFAAEMITKYLQADAAGRADIEAFHMSEGPAMVRESHLAEVEGTPTSADIEKIMGTREQHEDFQRKVRELLDGIEGDDDERRPA